MTSPSVPPLVLIVEDDPDTREMYAMYLELSGLSVLTATDAATAFELVVHHQPHMVISDDRLAGPGTGADLCQRLREDLRTTHIPTLLLTGAARLSDGEEAPEGGCAQIRIKPYLPDELLNDIREALSRSGGQPVIG